MRLCQMMKTSRREFLSMGAFLGLQFPPFSSWFSPFYEKGGLSGARFDEGNPYLQSVYAPIEEEVEISNLPVVEGKIPEEIQGAYFRNGPNPTFPSHPHHWFDGDGMIHRIGIQDGKASYCNRYVRTKARALEQWRGRKLFPGLHELTRLGATAGVAASALLLNSPLKDTSNTDLIYFNGQIISLWWLSGRPYALDPITLEPQGLAQFEGYHGNMAAHARIDPRTGELFFIDFRQTRSFVRVGALDSSGKLKWKREFTLPAPRIYHDVLFTENYVILMDFPVGLKFVPKIGIGLDQNYPSRIILIPRDGVSPEKIYELDPCYVLHGLNAYEQDGTLFLSVNKFNDPFGEKIDLSKETRIVPYVGTLRVETVPVLWRLNSDYPRHSRWIDE